MKLKSCSFQTRAVFTSNHAKWISMGSIVHAAEKSINEHTFWKTNQVDGLSRRWPIGCADVHAIKNYPRVHGRTASTENRKNGKFVTVSVTAHVHIPVQKVVTEKPRGLLGTSAWDCFLAWQSEQDGCSTDSGHCHNWSHQRWMGTFWWSKLSLLSLIVVCYGSIFQQVYVSIVYYLMYLFGLSLPIECSFSSEKPSHVLGHNCQKKKKVHPPKKPP